MRTFVYLIAVVWMGLLMPVVVWAQDAPLVAVDFEVPVHKAFSDYQLKKIGPQYAELDYEALMSARHVIRERLGTAWPEDTFTLAENGAQLEDDARAFEQKTRFTYTVLSPQGSDVLGCVYISGPYSDDSDATVFLWVRKREQERGLEQQLLRDVQGWMDEAWPFENVAYPFN